MKPRLIIARSLQWLAALLGAWLALQRPAIAADAHFLEPEVAFPMVAVIRSPTIIELRFDIAPGYYLYRKAFDFTVIGATLGTPQIPPGQAKFDEAFGKTLQTHRGRLRIDLPVTRVDGPFKLSVISQGCADAGLCYPPMMRSFVVDPKLLRSGGASLQVDN